jgi:hypothetical protein
LHATGVGTTFVGFNAIILVPADETLLILQTMTPSAGGRSFTLDPFSGQLVSQVISTSRIVPDQVRAAYVGAPPILTPGQDCNLVAFQTVGTVEPPVTSATSAPVSFDLAFWPRYLTVA